MKIFVWAVIIIVGAAIIAGFFVVGSPQTERLRRFDNRRMSDLQNIQSQIVNFWQSKGRLPDLLDELRDDISGWSAPRDPQTAVEYGYIKGEDLNFSLCANFIFASNEVAVEFPAYPLFGLEENWAHPEGKYCFERRIDPDRYPQFEKPAVR